MAVALMVGELFKIYVNGLFEPRRRTLGNNLFFSLKRAECDSACCPPKKKGHSEGGPLVSVFWLRLIGIESVVKLLVFELDTKAQLGLPAHDHV